MLIRKGSRVIQSLCSLNGGCWRGGKTIRRSTWPSCMRTSRFSQVPPHGLAPNMPGDLARLDAGGRTFGQRTDLEALAQLGLQGGGKFRRRAGLMFASGRSSRRTLPLLATFR